MQVQLCANRWLRLKRIAPRFPTPEYAILSFGLFVTAIAISGSFATLATLLVAVEQIIFTLVLISFGVL